MRRNYHRKLSVEIITGNYEEIITGNYEEIITGNYEEKLSLEIILKIIKNHPT